MVARHTVGSRFSIARLAHQEANRPSWDASLRRLCITSPPAACGLGGDRAARVAAPDKGREVRLHLLLAHVRGLDSQRLAA